MKEILDILAYFKNKGVALLPDAAGQRLEATGNLKALTEADKATIARHRDAILAFLNNARQPAAQPIRPLPQQESYALSSAQKRVWVLSLFDEGNTAYNMAGVYAIEGKIDRDALQQAFDALMERHESLRTVFKEDTQGEPRQWILPAADLHFAIAHHDLRDGNGTAGLQDALALACQAPFDLANGPLLRASLYQTGNSQWVLAYAMHHIISDGWSTGILMDELQQLYHSYRNGTAYPLAPLQIQYKEYAAWQQAQLSGSTLLQHRQYWLQQMAGELPVCNLLGDRPRPPIKTYNGALLHKQIPLALATALKTLCQQQQATLFMGLLAAVKALLHRYTGQQDIVVGSPIAGRENAQLENQIGFYLNTLALRTQLDANDSFAALLGNVQKVTLGAYQHQSFPFDELVEALALRRDMGRSALFDIMVILQNTGSGAAEGRRLGDAVISAYKGSLPVASKFDITFDFAENSEGIGLSLEYNTDIYDAATIGRLANHLEWVLQQVVSDPNTVLAQLDLVTDVEAEQILTRFNHKAAAYNEGKTLVDLLEAQAAATPQAIALELGSASFTYATLNGDANRLARYLQSAQGANPGGIVAICLPRGYHMLLAMVAVLKTGAAYLPIETGFPQERIDYLKTDSGCKALLDETALAGFEAVKNSYADDNLGLPIGPGDTAYLMYTSGSTGRPKGVVVEHRNVVSFFENFAPRFGLQPGMAMGGTTNYTFDISVLELLGCLATGIKLLLVANPEPETVLQLIEEGRITALQVTPSRLGQLLELGADTLPKLQVLLVGGEALGPYQYNTLKQWAHTKTVNVYGPTEATIWSTALDIASSKALSIGQPLINETVYVLSPQHLLQPIGAVGEIGIGGTEVARGYLNRPELTQEKFIADPFVPGGRIYKTGDLGRWLPDGNIEFLGRNDGQVKIRGHRVEPGEIAAALQSQPGIEAAVVTAFAGPGGELELAAYWVGSGTWDAAGLKTALAKSLPAYMVPGYFVQLEALPLNTSGKVDRAKLPQPDGSAAVQANYVAPRNETEAQLVALWQQVLGQGPIGVQHNFFELGGHSLKATRLISLLYKTFGVKLALKDIFMYPLPEQQALLIKKTEKTAYADIQPTGAKEYYPLSAAQKRLFFLQEFAPDSAGYNMSMVNYLGATVDTDKMERAMRQLIDRHESLRTSFEKIDGVAWQKVHPTVDFVLGSHQCPPEAFEAWLRGFIRPFDLGQAPLIRSALVHIEPWAMPGWLTCTISFPTAHRNRYWPTISCSCTKALPQRPYASNTVIFPLGKTI
jgi:amino acid adenylation domain-containing protein